MLHRSITRPATVHNALRDRHRCYAQRMELHFRSRVFGTSLTQSACAATAFALTLLVVGCASPGVPRSPSLNLPGPVNDLSALRRGTSVDLHFTMPQHNTDHLPLRADTMTATLCRAVETAVCVPVAALSNQIFARVTNGHPTVATLHDTLPDVLTSGSPRLLSYRVELFNALGHTAGFSDPAYTVAGAAPPAVEGLSVQGSRLGVVVSWNGDADTSKVTLRREDLAPKPPPPTSSKPPAGKSSLPHATKASAEDEPNVVWLTAAPPASDAPARADILLDTTALADEPYRYAAERRRSVQLGGRTLEMRSALSAPIPFTLHDIYPPPVPTDLSAASFAVSNTDPAAGLAIDLIWQPVDDAGLSGYNIYRQSIDANGTPTSPTKRLNGTPLRLPAFHDTLPAAATEQRYRYSVTSVDAKGNESAACVTTLNPNQP